MRDNKENNIKDNNEKMRIIKNLIDKGKKKSSLTYKE
jgi:RNA polymerase primary sigma factor